MRTLNLRWLVSLILCLACSQAWSGERKLRYFASYDYYFPGTSGQGLKDQLKNVSDTLLAVGANSTNFSVITHGGIGTRVGVLYPIDTRTSLGGSLGYVVGPTMNSDFRVQSATLGNGGLTVNQAVAFVRFLAESRISFDLGRSWRLNLGSGAGGAMGRVNQSCSASGSIATICTDANVAISKTWGGFAWEFSPSFSYQLKAADINLGMRYAGYPKFKGIDQIAPIEWQAFGFFLGATF